MSNDGNPPYIIIAGYGLSGRWVADLLKQRGIPFIVIELNAHTVTRCLRGGVNILEGDARDEQVLRAAGIDRAAMLVITLPDEAIVLDAIETGRRLNPTIKIIARCTFTSAGLKATRRGADEVLVVEQIMAYEFSRVIENRLNAPQVQRDTEQR